MIAHYGRIIGGIRQQGYGLVHVYLYCKTSHSRRNGPGWTLSLHPVPDFRSLTSGPWLPVLDFRSLTSGPWLPVLDFRSLTSGQYCSQWFPPPDFRPPYKKCLFPAQQVPIIMASRAATHLFILSQYLPLFIEIMWKILKKKKLGIMKNNRHLKGHLGGWQETNLFVRVAL